MTDYTYTLKDHAARNEANHFDRPLLMALLDHYKPESLIDIGAGVGWYCREAALAGVRNVVGIEKTEDIHKIAVYQVTVSDAAKHTIKMGKFDLCLCIEVAQYIAAANIPKLIDNCCNASDVIVFSAAQFGQQAPNAITFLPPYIYCDMFKEHGYQPVADWFEWREKATLPWIKRNMVIYERCK